MKLNENRRGIHRCRKTKAHMNAWIGRSWPQCQRKKLFLGESWWGLEESVHLYMCRWCKGSQVDPFFTRIFNACSGNPPSSATTQQKLAFWDSLAFMNFVYWSVGTTNQSKANKKDFAAAQPYLDIFLRVLRPDVVWILGTTQAVYSRPVIQRLGIKYVVTRHPRSGVLDATLLADFKNL